MLIFFLNYSANIKYENENHPILKCLSKTVLLKRTEHFMGKSPKK
jgi:hypothetical protein